jgi:hypothetical protein
LIFLIDVETSCPDPLQIGGSLRDAIIPMETHNVQKTITHVRKMNINNSLRHSIGDQAKFLLGALALHLGLMLNCCAVSESTHLKSGEGATGSHPNETEGRLVRELSTPFQIALVYPVQLSRPDSSVIGLRVNLFYGRNKNLSGVDLGFTNHITGQFRGVQLGATNVVESSFAGIQEGILFNDVEGDFAGLQGGALGGAVKGTFQGVQGGFLNVTTSGDFYGWQVSALSSVCDKDMRGLQVSSLINLVKGECKGIQIGAVNFCDRLKGVQIGLINIVENGPVKFLPLINACF